MESIKTPDALSDWMRDAKKGSVICYFEGLLMRSRALHDPAGYTPGPLAAAKKVWGYHLMGRVELVQKRLGDGHYQYLARKVL